MHKTTPNTREQVLKRFGREVARRRQVLGISQEALAESSGLHRTYIGAVERGLRNPTLTSILLLSKGLRCRPSEILAEAGS